MNYKNKQLVYCRGSVRIAFLELDRFVLNGLVLTASLALMTSQCEKMLKT